MTEKPADSLSERTKRIARALYVAMPQVSEVSAGPAHAMQQCADRIAPLVERAIEAALNGGEATWDAMAWEAVFKTLEAAHG